MKTLFTEEEKTLLGLLRGEMCSDTALVAQAKRLANQQGILPLLGEILKDDEAVYQSSMRNVRQYYYLLFKTKYYVNLLSEAGIETVILKGFPVAKYYPIPQLRKSGDIDLLLLHPEEITKAIEVLTAHGVMQMEEQHANYHVALMTKEKIEIELHTSLTEELDDARVNQKLKLLEKELSEHVEWTYICDNLFPVLSPGYQAFSLLLHMLHHFMRSGFGLKLLMDWTYFWNHGMDEEERKIYDRCMDTIGLRGFSEMISSACYFELGLKDASLLGEQIRRETAESFLKDVLESYEFGSVQDQQMVKMRGTKMQDFLREFHHQMHLNYPKAGKVWVIWPVLWIATLVRFLVNNHTVRNTSMVAVLRNAKSRSSYMEEIKLFQK